jgi:hypothetical protein
MGHSIRLDTYGTPTPEEAAAGMPVHGEAAVVPYTINSRGELVSANDSTFGATLVPA